MISFLTLPIRLVGIVLLATLMFHAIAPMRSLESKLANLSTSTEASVVATTAPTSHEALPFTSVGLWLVAIVSIWLVYRTYCQQIGLANSELRNRRAAKKLRQ